MRVSEIMTRDVVAVPLDAALVEAAELMRDHNIGLLPVILTTAADILAYSHIHTLIVVDSDIKLSGLLSLDGLAMNMSSNRLLNDLVRRISTASQSGGTI